MLIRTREHKFDTHTQTWTRTRAQERVRTKETEKDRNGRKAVNALLLIYRRRGWFRARWCTWQIIAGMSDREGSNYSSIGSSEMAVVRVRLCHGSLTKMSSLAIRVAAATSSVLLTSWAEGSCRAHSTPSNSLRKDTRWLSSSRGAPNRYYIYINVDTAVWRHHA